MPELSVMNRISVRSEASLAGPDWATRTMALPEAVHRDRILQDTWGHLAPARQRPYHGWILFTYTAWGEMVLINAEFADLDDSPWFFEDLREFVADQCFDDRRGEDRLPEGGVYLWQGTYLRFKNGNCRFSGKARTVVAAETAP